MATVPLRQADPQRDRAALRQLWREYLDWGGAELEADCGVGRGDPAAMVEHDLTHLDLYAPPHGALLLCEDAQGLLASIALRPNAPGVGEVKRLYVRPRARGLGLGHALVRAVLQAATQAGYRQLRLDSARFMTAAHALYRAHGFETTAPYAGTDVPPDLQPYWVFMSRELAHDAVSA